MRASLTRHTTFVVALLSIVFAGTSARTDVLERTKKVAGMTVHYKVVLPAGLS